ncbi:MAG TPA: HTTM domain-containing protein [Polyangiaceae bacterium]|nr:HTTM domain-containing protein [Polyangiaceae bacterium]
MKVRLWIDEPQPILRLELIRILAPLASLGFLSSRLAHPGEWVGDAGFRLPRLYESTRHPLDIPALHGSAATLFAAVVVLSALALSAGFRPRVAALLLAGTVAYAALGDRLSTFTVTKLTPALCLALAASPCGAAYGVDAWLRRRRDPSHFPPTRVAGGSVRFFQAFLCCFYCASGVAKALGDWTTHPLVLWTHLHDSLQTRLSVLLANTVPASGWTLAQALVLVFEIGAPLWFAWPRTRPHALLFGLGMHTFIGLCFWPVRWFALLMMSLLLGSFLPEAWLSRAEESAATALGAAGTGGE